LTRFPWVACLIPAHAKTPRRPREDSMPDFTPQFGQPLPKSWFAARPGRAETDPRSVRVLAPLLLGQELLELGAKLLGGWYRLIASQQVLAVRRERVILLLERLHDFRDFR
jgi:hypothetical protein